MSDEPMMPDDGFEQPRANVRDLLYEMAAKSAGAVTLGAGETIVKAMLAAPLEKRRTEWFDRLVDELRRLDQVKLDVNDLPNNAQFVDAVLHATQAATRTSSEEKRDALKNAVLNSAILPASDTTPLFLSWVDSLTPWHLRILYLFRDPMQWFRLHNIEPPAGNIVGTTLNKIIERAYPELASDTSLQSVLVRELYSRNLTNQNSDRLMLNMDNSALTQTWTTHVGGKFVEFITRPPDGD